MKLQAMINRFIRLPVKTQVLFYILSMGLIWGYVCPSLIGSNSSVAVVIGYGILVAHGYAMYAFGGDIFNTIKRLLNLD